MTVKINIQERTKLFAIRSIKAYSRIVEQKNFNDPATVLATRAFPCDFRRRGVARQFLRSSTSIGANCSEAVSAQSRKDFIHKYEIALKEARETQYWIEIFIKSEIVSKHLFSSLTEEINTVIKILVKIIKSSKSNL